MTAESVAKLPMREVSRGPRVGSGSCVRACSGRSLVLVPNRSYGQIETEVVLLRQRYVALHHFGEEVVALVVDDYESREVLDFNLKHGFHA